MAILITGAAGFIGFSVASRLIAEGKQVIGIDNLNDYYDVNLKEARLNILKNSDNFTFHQLDISDKSFIDDFLERYPNIEYIVHLAAQPGVRYSIENPFAYASTNVMGHLCMLELARHLPNLKHMLYASSSSVYGGNKKMPFSTEDNVDKPISLYAATKKSDELMSYCYSHLYDIALTGFRFFTVYGEWGRPDMATFKFTKAILNGDPIDVYNNGDMRRDFTYIDDIVDGIILCLDNLPKANPVRHKVYNLGNNTSENLLDYVHTLEETIGKKAVINLMPMQDGDVKETYADITDSIKDFGFSPKTNIKDGLPKFVKWYKEYYKL